MGGNHLSRAVPLAIWQAHRVLSAVHKNGLDLAGSQCEHNAEISWKAPTAFVIIAGTVSKVDKIMKSKALK